MYSSIVWGINNIVYNQYSSIVWWSNNVQMGGLASIWGWAYNTGMAFGWFIGWGFYNEVVGDYSFIWAGSGNLTQGNYSVVAWGRNNKAIGQYSMAAWQNAIASGINSFMRNDWSVVHPWGTLTIFNQTINIPAINWSANDNEFMVNSEKIVIGNIENSSLLYRWSYVNWWIDTYLPGVVVADQFWAIDISATNWSFWQSLTLGNNPVLTSDSRFKTGVATINGALNVINGLNPVQFQWAENEYTENMHRDPSVINYGLIAQDVQGVLPTLVEEIPDTFFEYEWNKEGWDFLWVKYIEIIPILIGAVKEQQAIIQDLEFRLSNLEGGPIE